MYRRITHYSLILGLTCMLSACGFQLRGTGADGITVPDTWKSMFLITHNPNSELTRDVVTLFAAQGVQWTDQHSANFSLALGSEEFKQLNVSLNSEARVAEFELTMSTFFSVLDADKNAVIPQTRVTVLKRMQNDPRNVVGKTGEVRLLQSEMRTELAQQIMRRIAFFAANTQPNTSSNSP